LTGCELAVWTDAPEAVLHQVASGIVVRQMKKRVTGRAILAQHQHMGLPLGVGHLAKHLAGAKRTVGMCGTLRIEVCSPVQSVKDEVEVFGLPSSGRATQFILDRQIEFAPHDVYEQFDALERKQLAQ
jgi:hypothetical protein